MRKARTNVADPLCGALLVRAVNALRSGHRISSLALHGALGGCGGSLHADDGGMPLSVMTTIEIITDSVNSDSTPRDIYMKHYECLDVNYE